MREAVTQLIKFYANFSRAKTLDEAYMELGMEFIRLTEQPKPKKSHPRAPESEAGPTPDQLSRNALR